MLTVEQAQAKVLERVAVLEPVRVGLADALGCVLAADVVSDIDVAPFDNSAMDGYAVRAADTTAASDAAPALLRVVEHIPAGVAPALPVGAGEASRIMTGAPVPEGADAIVMVEHTESREADGGPGGTVAVMRAATAGDHVRRAGEDVRAGETVLAAGEPVGPAAVGLMAAVGAAEVEVRRRPVVGVMATGDELVDVSERPGPGRIRNSNSFSLAAQVAVAGAVPHVLPVVRDTLEDTRAALARAAEFDLMVSTGGVSMGDFDLVKGVLEEVGEMDFWKVAMRPGAPQTFGTVDGTPFFGLPGNPTSTMVGFELFVRPAIRRMRGCAELYRPRTRALLSEPVRKKPDRRYFMRGCLERSGTWPEGGAGAYAVRLSGRQSSAMLTAMHRANCLISIPEGASELPAGTEVECIRLDMEEGTP